MKLPPRSAVKKCMPNRRSSISSDVTTVSGGNAITMMMLAKKTVHTNTVMRMNVMPGARRLMIVTRKLIADIVLPHPAIHTAHSQESTPTPGLAIIPDSGG